MYLARKRINYRETHFIIRHSFKGPGYMISRDVFDLGTNPDRFIHYPGGNSYYIDLCVEEALHEHGLEVSQNDLDRLFFDFFPPETRRLIESFQRRVRKNPKNRVQETLSTPHKFDKRRYCYLRFGSRRRQYLSRVDEKVFRPLQNKSRDEIEQYFFAEERILKPREISDYISTIFEMKSFVPRVDSGASPVEQLDDFFMDRLCGINSDRDFMAGVPGFPGLYEQLVRYAVMYFDSASFLRPPESIYIHDFINRHRDYRPPAAVQRKIREAEQLFGRTWKELQQMDKASLSRLYRQLALKHHPDQGGDGDIFLRLTAYYENLLRKKRV